MPIRSQSLLPMTLNRHEAAFGVVAAWVMGFCDKINLMVQGISTHKHTEGEYQDERITHCNMGSVFIGQSLMKAAKSAYVA